jgi:hypothetical protein
MKTVPNKHIMFIRFAHWDANSLAGASRKYSQQVCAPYVKRYVPKDGHAQTVKPKY